jgi:hypothetical protein
MISAEKVINIKVVKLIKIYKFYFGQFFILQSVSKHWSQIHKSHIKFMKLDERYVNLWIMFSNTLSNEEMTKIKVVDLDKFKNFYIHDFLHLKSYTIPKCYFKLSFLKIQILNHSNKVTWQDDRNKSFRSWWVQQLLYWWLFKLRSFSVSKSGLKL